MANIGYARVSTAEQNHALQHDALTAAGCERVFTDTISGSLAAADRPGLKQAMDYLREGDTLVIYSLSRLGRKTTDVLSTLEALHERGVFFRSVTENLDTSTPMGRVLVTLIAALAQMEREVLVERTQAGLAAARARGRVGGRPGTMTDERDAVARNLYASGTPVLSIASTLGVSKASVTRSLARTRTDAQSAGV